MVKKTLTQSSSKREATTEYPLASPTADKKELKVEQILVLKRNHVLSVTISNIRVTKMFSICEESAAKTSLKAVTFNKDSVYTRCILFKGVGDVYAADVLYHNNCLNRYIKKLWYDVDAVVAFEVDDDRPVLEDTFKELIPSVKIETGICSIRRKRLDK